MEFIIMARKKGLIRIVSRSHLTETNSFVVVTSTLRCRVCSLFMPANPNDLRVIFRIVNANRQPLYEYWRKNIFTFQQPTTKITLFIGDDNSIEATKSLIKLFRFV